ncbi:hypothetical protein ACIOGZ_28820 [Kitasatospora sp. NPDC088160]|uniref:hypothetical protein n=1 Tax=Kitasatospora sp. NPDC088160 TaxID=3364072 RepID=UPI0037F68904
MTTNNSSGRSAKKRAAAKTTGAFNALNNLSQSGQLAAINNTLAPPLEGVSPTFASETISNPADLIPAQQAESLPVSTEAPAPEKHGAAPAVVTTSSPTPAQRPTEEPANFTQAPVTAPTTPVTESSVPAAEPVPAPAPVTAPTTPVTESSVPAAEPELATGLAVESTLPAVPGANVAAVTSTFRSNSFTLEVSAPNALPPALAKKVHGLPDGYLLLVNSYRIAKSAAPGRLSRTKRNVRLNKELAGALTRQQLADKRLLGLKDLKPSHYVDAALTFGRNADVTTLIEQADAFRERLLGEDDPFEDPNHFTITVANNDWLDEMLDELVLAKANGLHGYMINVIVEAYLSTLSPRSTL